ncbi:acyltransferase family protein [Massilia aerilata]|uniref:Acyltransferase family protein n=1 Tax=Massilia aerilata TaxID=453817 RepID=A0ABW0RQX6_9BURK
MPKVSLLEESRPHSDYYDSMIIWLLRGLAWLAVAAGHLRARVYPGFGSVAEPTPGFQAFAFLTGYAHLALVVLFVLSGWLVGGGMLDRYGSPGALRQYALKRLTRLWIVLIPAYTAMLLFAAYAGWADASSADLGGSGEYAAGAFIGNLLGLQTLAVPRFGGNYPLWTLANASWYYLLFPLLLAVFRARTAPARAGAVLAVLGIAAVLSEVMLLYFLVWLLGAAFSRVPIDAGPLARRLFLLLFLALAVYYRIAGGNNHMRTDTIVQDLAFGTSLALFLCSMRYRPAGPSRLRERVVAAGRFFAGFSFTLYVIHVPLIDAMQYFFGRQRLSPAAPLDYLVYAAMLAGIVALAYLFHLPFEANTQRVRAWMKERLAADGAGAARRTEPL